MQSIKKLRIETLFNEQIAARALMFFGGVCLLVGLTMMCLVFGPAIREEVNYQLSTKRKVSNAIPKPVDPTFSIMVPKIGANVRVIPNVDPYNPKEYQVQLAKGVAHAKGTVYPGQVGNTFLFAHSSRNWEVANQFNAVFYLLYKLKKDDKIFLSYQNKIFEYKVKELRYVDAGDVQYLSPDAKGKTLTLMTCWPPGTTAKRLVVIAIPNVPMP